MNRKPLDVLVLIALCFTLVWCFPSLGQVLKGSISSTVVDLQGAVVSGAQVKATQTGTGNVLTTKRDNAGLFLFQPDPDRQLQGRGFAQGVKTAVESDVPVSPGRDSDMGSIQSEVVT
jgi:hypothetical protein